jgi:subtilisin family serine protease
MKIAGCCGKLLLALACIALLTPAAEAQNGPGRHQRRPGTVLFKFKDDATPEQIEAACNILIQFNARLDRQLRDGASLRVSSPLAQVVSEETLAMNLLLTGAMAYAEPDYVVQAQLTPNDPSFAAQWWLTDVHAPAAWNTTTGTNSVIVAVCDTGVCTTHPDLAPNLILPGYNTYLNNTYVEDTVGHGTQAAGCIGARGNNGLGVAGMAWNVKILPIRITFADGNGSAFVSDMAEGLMYGADHGAKVINCSFSGFNASTIESAAMYCRNKGALVCFAAGNGAVDMTTATGYPNTTNIFVVGATTASETLAAWSNYGTPIDVVAPGDSILTTTLNGGYATVSGTSFASPIAAGLAALIFSVNPNFTPAAVEGFITKTCKNLGNNSNLGYGLIQADAAVALAAAPAIAPAVLVAPAAPTSLTATAAKKVVTLKWTDNAKNETAYYVESATKTGTSYGAYTRIATLAANATSFSQTVVTGSYNYRVQAAITTNSLVSAYSNVASVTVQ